LASTMNIPGFRLQKFHSRMFFGQRPARLKTAFRGEDKIPAAVPLLPIIFAPSRQYTNTKTSEKWHVVPAAAVVAPPNPEVNLRGAAALVPGLVMC
jgi:hypothetical protein